MSHLDQLFNQAVKNKISRNQIISITSGIATEITQTTCTVQREGLPDLLDVRLDAIDDALESQFTIYPVEGSNVIVGILNNLTTEAVVLKCSEVQNIKIKCQGADLGNTLSDFITEINNAIVNTPAGTGTISPATVQKLNVIDKQFKKIFR